MIVSSHRHVCTLCCTAFLVTRDGDADELIGLIIKDKSLTPSAGICILNASITTRGKHGLMVLWRFGIAPLQR